VAVAYDHPLEANWIDSVAIEGRPRTATSERRSANFYPVSWDYFRTVGTQILRGREFTPGDDQDQPGVVIVNEAFVRTFFPNQEPLGQRLQPSPPARIWEQKKLTSFEIIGIARDIKSSGLNAEAEPAYYLPAPQTPLPDMTILLRSQTEPESLVPAIRKTVPEYREAVTASSPTLPRFAATLGLRCPEALQPQSGCGLREVEVSKGEVDLSLKAIFGQESKGLESELAKDPDQGLKTLRSYRKAAATASR